MFTALDHVGIATPSLEQAVALYQDVFGLDVERREVLPDQGVEVLAFRCGESAVELLAPTRPDSPVGKFLADRGPGIHHIAYLVEDIRDALERARASGLELVDSEPRIGAGGHLVAFLHPRSTGKALIELVQHATVSGQGS
jgi:methylmalonyl-CoA/ethylmalonyl-CoA epimerase